MPLLLAVADVVARGDTVIDTIEDALEDTLKDLVEDKLEDGFEGALEAPDEMLAPGTEELEARELGTCDVDE
jgi:hypothetical protein